ncbi:unnamed protein product [Musa acuminata var. zebrina]
METTTTRLLHVLVLVLFLFDSAVAQPFLFDPINPLLNAGPAQKKPSYETSFTGIWELVRNSSGVSAMHLVITKENKAILFDSTNSGPSLLPLPAGNCRPDPTNKTNGEDCWAHAAEYDFVADQLRPLKVLTNTWCSSGGFAADGTLVQSGGFHEGATAVRYLKTCPMCDWIEYPAALSVNRWYATQQILPDGSFIVVGGRREFSYEFIPAPGQSNPSNYKLPFLIETTDDEENNLYPFLHLSTDGNLFIFANNRSILLDPRTHTILREFPPLKDGSHNYPASAASALLPLRLRSSTTAPIPAEVIICGGASHKSAALAAEKVFIPALRRCSRLTITKPNARWHTEVMPTPRVMADMLLLPTADVLIINGATKGTSGWGWAESPNLEPLLYQPSSRRNERFKTLTPTTIPRMYHSTSAVLPDTSILVAGSNPNNSRVRQTEWPRRASASSGTHPRGRLSVLHPQPHVHPAWQTLVLPRGKRVAPPTQMIACKSSSRFHCLLKVAFPPNVPLSSPLSRLQDCPRGQSLSLIWKMASTKDRHAESDRRKKRKSIMHVWRPISTQSASNEVDHSRSDVQCQLPELHQNKPSGVSDKEIATQEDSVMGISMTLTTSARAVDHGNDFETENVSTCHDLSTTSNSGGALEQGVMEGAVQVMNPTTGAELGSGVERHSISIEVGASLIHFIKGKGGSMQKQIEGELGVKIVFPSSKEDSNITIEGTVESVAKASEKIASILEEAVESPKLDYSHFISLPLALHPELVEKLNCFQNSIIGDSTFSDDDDLEKESNDGTTDDEDNQSERQKVAVRLEVQNEKECVKVKINAMDYKSTTRASSLTDMGIDRSIFIKPKTFHLTVLMLKLWNNERIAAAAEVLQRISSKVQDALENRPVYIRLQGLMCMRGSPAKARVVYAPVKEIGGEGRLSRACQVIIDAYVEAGLVLEKDAQQALKLHATLMNARHRKRKGRRTKRHDSFDARHIFRVYGSKDWGEYHIPEVHLSQRFKFDESGYYHCCTSIPLPESMQID